MAHLAEEALVQAGKALHCIIALLGEELRDLLDGLRHLMGTADDAVLVVEVVRGQRELLSVSGERRNLRKDRLEHEQILQLACIERVRCTAQPFADGLLRN